MTANRVRDFAVYIAIGLCVGLWCFWFAERDIDKKWLTLTLEAFLVFGSTIGSLKRLWRLSVFWIGIVVLLVDHLTAFGVVLRQISEWRAMAVRLISLVDAWNRGLRSIRRTF